MEFAVQNSPLGKSELPFSITAFEDVKSRLSKTAPYSSAQPSLERGQHYTVVGESMTCSVNLCSKKFIRLDDRRGERLALLLNFTPEDFDGVDFAEHQVVCVALYVKDVDGLPLFLPDVVFGPSTQGDRLIVIKPDNHHVRE